MDTLQQINDIASSLLQSLPHRRPETLVLGSTARGALATSVDQTNVSFQYKHMEIILATNVYLYLYDQTYRYK